MHSRFRSFFVCLFCSRNFSRDLGNFQAHSRRSVHRRSSSVVSCVPENIYKLRNFLARQKGKVQLASRKFELCLFFVLSIYRYMSKLRSVLERASRIAVSIRYQIVARFNSVHSFFLSTAVPAVRFSVLVSTSTTPLWVYSALTAYTFSRKSCKFLG